jgi:predicted ester cyclase
MEPSDVRQLARLANDAFNDRDFEAFPRFIASDVEVIGPDAQYTGLDRFIASVHALISAFPDITFSFEDLIVEGNKAAYTTHVTATHEGSLQLPGGRTVPPTGRKVSVLMVSMREIRAGKVVRMVNGWDQLSLLTQLGLMSA